MKILISIFLLLSGLTSHAFYEEEVEMERNGCVLKGTLTAQDDPSQSTPLIILIGGSGPTDRNGNNPYLKNNSLLMISTVLVENGYACLRYDKRGIADSQMEIQGDQNMRFDDFVLDAVGWVDQYAADVRFHSIVLSGHSQGSLVAMLAAERNENVRAVISLSGAGEPIQNILKFQLEGQLSPQQKEEAFGKLDSLAGGDSVVVVPDYLEGLMYPEIQPFMKSWMKYDPAKIIADLRIPILLVNGTTDLQVTIDQVELLAAANENAEKVIIKNMNHVLKFTKETQMLSQMEVYGDPDVPLHKKLIKTILSFLGSLE